MFHFRVLTAFGCILLLSVCQDASAQQPANPNLPAASADDTPEPEAMLFHLSLAHGLAGTLAKEKHWDHKTLELAQYLLKGRYLAALQVTADVIRRRPHADLVEPLLELLKRLPPEEPTRGKRLLTLSVNVAFRECLKHSELWPADSHPIYTEAALAIRNFSAARYLWVMFRNKKIPPEQAVEAITHLAKYGDIWLREDLVTALELHCPISLPLAMMALAQGTAAASGGMTDRCATRIASHIQDAIHRIPTWKVPPDGAEVVKLVSMAHVLLGLPALAASGITVTLPYNSISSHAKIAANPNLPFELRMVSLQVLLNFSARDAVVAGRLMLDEPTVSPELRDRVLLMLATYGDKEARLDARDAMNAAPYRVAVAVGTALAKTPNGAEDLLNAVKIGKAPARLLQEKAIREQLWAAEIPGLDKQLAALTKGLPPLEPRLAELITKRGAAFAMAKPNKEAGAKVYAKHCGACHKIGEAAGKIAPALDGIGLRGLERLLEDTLNPNRDVAQGFRARIITTKDEKPIIGLMLRVEDSKLIVADGEGKELRIPIADIVANRETMLSPMPANFGDVIPEADFADLLAYLLDQKTPVKR